MTKEIKLEKEKWNLKEQTLRNDLNWLKGKLWISDNGYETELVKLNDNRNKNWKKGILKNSH